MTLSGSKLVRTSFEPDSVMEFGLKVLLTKALVGLCKAKVRAKALLFKTKAKTLTAKAKAATENTSSGCSWKTLCRRSLLNQSDPGWVWEM